ncbi:hypothetical protein DPMN_069273 [Dreissena polymorpha]|uniref:PiggyBac transposable element-derived protein 4 C-terminal zinc-ribbon domain-containing protein n=1 Tax=Dreissena polymorpha TaxID=45954 RepID=A0A9D3YYQ7_DREPO|nr:hypothetical protein DPMN_069273 [Dreissena polymorpha]
MRILWIKLSDDVKQETVPENQYTVPENETLKNRCQKCEQGNMGSHVLSRLSDKTKTCKYHTRYLKKRRETKYGCATCGVHLCRDGCFVRFHNLL